MSKKLRIVTGQVVAHVPTLSVEGTITTPPVTLTPKEKLDIARTVIQQHEAPPAPPDLAKAVRERLPRTASRPRRETFAEHADRLAGLFRAFVTPVSEQKEK